MNILVVVPYLPWPLNQGGKIRAYHLIRQLAREHKVALVCLSSTPGGDLAPLTGLCSEVVIVSHAERTALSLARFLLGTLPFNCQRFFSSELSRVLPEIIRRQEIEAVMVESPLLWPALVGIAGVQWVVDAQNVEYQLVRHLGDVCANPLKKMLYRVEERRLRLVEEACWRAASSTLAVSSLDAAIIAAVPGVQADRVVVAENGVDLDFFPFRPDPDAGGSVLLLGGMEYAPNLAANQFFLAEILPRLRQLCPGVRVTVAGRQLWRLGAAVKVEGVTVVESPEDVRPLLREAAVLAVPLLTGGGTRLKIVEALSLGTPVVTTAKGCEGLRVTSNEHLLVADAAPDFAAAVARLLADQPVARALAVAGRQLMCEQYDWEKIGATVRTAVSRLAGGGNPCIG